MYVSFDDGDSWQSLMLNLPTTSFRDITFRGNDLIVGTYGRGIFVLDDYAVLRQISNATANEDVRLFKPDAAVRVRRNVGADTPFPPRSAARAQSARRRHHLLLAWIEARAAESTLDVLDSAGAAVRHYSSDPIAPVPEAARPPHPNFWVTVEQPLPADAGMHRVNLGSALRRATGIHALIRDQRQSRPDAGVARRCSSFRPVRTPCVSASTENRTTRK